MIDEHHITVERHHLSREMKKVRAYSHFEEKYNIWFAFLVAKFKNNGFE